MKIAIIGIGAMGSLFGAHLHPLADVTLLGEWPEQLTALRENGLLVEMSDGRTFRTPLRATNIIADVAPADLALILVKSHKTAAAANVARQVLAEDGLTLTLQNGLGNLETLAHELTPHPAALGVTSAGAAMAGPGHVRVAGMGHTYLAPPTGPGARVTLAEVAALFQQAGFPTDLTDNPISLVWGKLAINAGINPLTALLRVPNGYLAKNPAARAIMFQAANETAAVAHAQGIVLPYADAAQRALDVARDTATNQSSMLQDVLRGARTEIEAICGAVVSYGRRYHVPTPVNEVLLAEIKRLEIGGLEMGRLKIDQAAIISHLQSQISTQENL
ncbi:MAG: 2-dehydropantoate 2-reductase [Chloroflexi bacterium]|nr:2-dehydropantoate 2-reductase [Ardenticatenaceae bacterium]MBL1127987.1 2-dehydropantoate 2-reductase [Chloroflexota bacterium]NOG34059.1 2-dehydropantoate 2-reductase [Chloroflexota bacterium]GIK54477.1 MAG: 2-dehydropantoate 2-reductase [Chloroflexota bacterium]